MRNLYLISFICLVSVPNVLWGQVFTVYDSFTELEKRIQQVDEHTTLVLNFWATWCAPCVEELPSFNELYQKHADTDFQVIMVSLDFKSRLEKTLVPFLEKSPLKPEIALLADQDADSWIPQIHPNWEGTIPATVVIRGGQRSLFPEKFQSYEALESFVLNFVNKVQKATCMGSKGTR